MKTRNIKTVVALAVMALTAASCRQADTYRIAGTAEALADGDTLLLITDVSSGMPSDTLFVKDGRFAVEGKADSAVFCMIVGKNANASFFREPGTITIDLKADANATVGGTEANDAWQKLNDAMDDYNTRVQQLATQIYAADTDEATHQALIEQFTQLQDEMNRMAIDMAEANIGNEMGFFVVTNMFQNDALTPERCRQLIDKMPARFRARPAVAEMEEALAGLEATGEGSKMPDFTLTTPEGEALSAMSVVGSNRVTIIDFWASWCGPCRQEMPFMRELYDRLHEKGLGMVGVSLDDDGDAWGQAIDDMRMTWPQMSDLEGWSAQPAQMFNVRAIPFTVVVAQDGTILKKGLRGQDLEDFVTSLLD